MNLEDMQNDSLNPQTAPFHPWKARFLVGMIMLMLGFIGLVATDVAKNGAWRYWEIIAPIYALLSLGLSGYLRRKKYRVFIVTIWHEIFHWLGLILAVYLTSFFVSIGIMSRFAASLDVLGLLAFSLFIAGIYVESTFLLIGISLGCFAAGVAFLSEYLFAIMIPLTLLIALVIFGMAYFKRRALSEDIR